MNPTLFAELLSQMTSPDALNNFISQYQVDTARMFVSGLLPTVESTEAEIRNGNVTFTAEAAHATAPDSPYAKIGGVKVTDFSAESFKITSSNALTEKDQKAMHARAQAAFVRSGGSVASLNPVYSETIAKFSEAILVLPFVYAYEKYGTLALSDGRIKGNFNGILLDVDYGLKAAQRLDRKTVAKGNYTGNQSKLWEDADFARRVLHVEPNLVTNAATGNAILSQAANSLSVLENVQVSETVQRYTVVKRDATGFVDARYRLTLWVYSGADSSGVAYWPDNRANFLKITPASSTLGRIHIAPNAELGMISGRYTHVYRPEGEPYQIHARASENILPEIDVDNLIVTEQA